MFSCWVMSNCLWPHGLKHARLPCPSPSPWVCSSSCPLSWWCHPTIASSAAFSSCLQSFPASGSCPVSWLTEYSVLISFRTDWFDLLAVQGTLKNLPSLAPQFKSISYSECSLLYCPTLIPVLDYWKTIDLTMWTFVSEVMSLLFSTLSSFVITFLPGSKCLLISWLQSASTVILEPKKIQSVSASTLKNHSSSVFMHKRKHIGNWKLFIKAGLIGFFFVAACSMQDLSSPTRDRTCTPMQWKCSVLVTGPPGNSQNLFLYMLD